MLIKTFDIVYSARDKIINMLYEAPPLAVLEKLQEIWIRYKPQIIPDPGCVGSIDSGYNWIELRGYYLYILNAGYIDTCSNKYEYAEIDIRDLADDPREYIDARSIRSELEVLREVIDLDNKLILVDGSLIKKIYSINKFLKERPDIELSRQLRDIARVLSSKDLSKIIFVAKNSGSQELVRSIIGELYNKPDIHLLEEYTSEIGFAKHSIFPMEFLGIEFKINIAYIRLEAKKPILRIEYFKESNDMDYLRKILDILYSISHNGYPIILSLIDKLVRVSDDDIMKIINLLDITDLRNKMKFG
ncbi:MAG: DNA double-strand break repair nuclease NurA [Sulfolobales archaeon]